MTAGDGPKMPGPPDKAFVLERLRETPVFSALPLDELTALADEVEMIRINAGATLAEQGDPADGAYILVSGRLRAFAVQADGSEKPVGEIAAGELVGEMALLAESSRGATVRAVRDCQLFFIKSSSFNRIIHTRPEATLAIARVLVDRLARSNAGRQAAQRRRAVTLIPAFGSATEIIERLAAALLESDGARVIRENDVASALGADHSEATLVHWLHRAEAEAGLVAYVATDVTSPWAGRTLRQADHIVAVDADPGAGHDDTRTIDTLEALTVGAVGPSIEVVCAHAAGAERPTGAARWMGSRKIRVNHIRRGADADIGRVRRAILRKDIAVVLSGGGARGLAHVGVLRAFDEANIPVDVIGGTSFGAIVTMLRALDMSWHEMRDVLWEGVGRRGAPVDVTAPAVALSKGQRLGDVLRDVFGDARIEDAWLPCFCVASNLSTGHPLVMTTGPMAAALRASVAIPGVFPPVATADGEVLVDGAVMNNLPVDVMAGMSNGGPIVAVNLRSPAHLSAGELTAEGVISGWRTLGRRLRPFRASPQIPSMVEILVRANDTGGAEATRMLELSADFLLHPPTADHAFLDFSALDDLIRAGYEYTLAELEAWEKSDKPLLVG